MNQDETILLDKETFSAVGYSVTNEHKIIIGHDIPDDVYEELVEEGKTPEICLEMFRSES